ncbi:Bug family tripartite tricarboxylate transporter substrate binding protein [Aquibacillus sediminis]|uniref:Bug family tripartite tricarboxylate transporter substrate binding protein n=1 Tax=Aquibacillus sediminis TaxID=2574734 RepID=UPI0011097051|nr:tripartite tricarboxylate transporter substrate-binding protein [Aquibacillus sediminis]
MKKKLWMLLVVAVLGALLAACNSETEDVSEGGQEADQEAEEVSGDAENTSGEEASVDLNRIRVVIGSSSTGGDTYQNADAVSRYTEEALDTNMKVDAVGALRAFDELGKANDDGSTIMFFHDMAYLGVEYGSFDQDDELENWRIGPVVATNPGNAFLTSADAPYDTMAESAEWLEENPDETITVALESGGVSEIVFDGYYLWVEEEYGTDVTDRIHAYVTGSQEDKNQALWDGNTDIIHGSIGANKQYTEDGVEDKIKMKFLGITAGERVEGFDVPTFAEQGITVDGEEFVFDKEFFFLMPKNVDENFATALNDAIADVVKNPDYEEDLNTNTYIVNHKPADEAEEYLLDKREKFRSIIERAPDLDEIAK